MLIRSMVAFPWSAETPHAGMVPAIFLHTLDSIMVEEWRTVFKAIDSVQVIEGDILSCAADAIVSPANSFGYMDGGIDLAYRRFFGDELHEHLQERIRTQFSGELVVGQATIVRTGHDALPHLISAPTMRVPDRIGDTVNVYLAFRAALIATLEYNRTDDRRIGSVRAPGLGTGVGGMSARRAALQMYAAFEPVFLTPGRAQDPLTLLARHEDLRSS